MPQTENNNLNSNNDIRAHNDYVRQDVFDANMKRIDQRFDSMEKMIDERFKAMDERFRSMEMRMDKNLAEFKAIVSDMRGEMNVINARLNGLENTVYWGFAIIAFILAFFAFIPPFTEFFKNLRRPALSVEDVERIVQAAIQKANMNKA